MEGGARREGAADGEEGGGRERVWYAFYRAVTVAARLTDAEHQGATEDSQGSIWVRRPFFYISCISKPELVKLLLLSSLPL